MNNSLSCLNSIFLILLFYVLFLILSSGPAKASDGFADVDNINVSGKLIASTCDVINADENHVVDFSNVNVSDIYANSHGLAKEFVIIAKNCKPENDLTINFSGRENEALPGLLNISGDAQGIGIGLKSGGINGVPVSVNSHSNLPSAVRGEDIVFILGAYIKGEPQAVKDKNIVLGNFSATANFILRYE
ncbi:fimbrial protein [Pantoea allii]|uniref:fimbrial protein n=1 Tax=Pantoea allii TaxID=574096 RepID=UPI0024B8545D|nr:fimbrial protein [Pantoea allii]MDJ0087762.1 fimbrial protein [Pantoea allii]